MAENGQPPKQPSELTPEQRAEINRQFDQFIEHAKDTYSCGSEEH